MKKHLSTVLAMCLMGTAAWALPKSATAPQKLIACEYGLMAPVWSPDGEQIAVTTDNYTGIMVARADGSQLRAVTDAQGAGYRMAWSADSKSIIGKEVSINGVKVNRQLKQWGVDQATSAPVAAKATESVYDIMVNDAAGATKRIASLADNAGRTVINPALSPDGTMIAFQIVSKGVWVCDANGENARQLCKGSHPAWLPDSKSLVITRVEDDGARFTASDIYAIDLVSGQEVLLTGATDVIPLTPAVSPDGKKVAFENAADAAIYVINLNY